MSVDTLLSKINEYTIQFAFRFDYIIYIATERRGPKPDSTPLKVLLKAIEAKPFGPKQIVYTLVFIGETWYYFAVVRKTRV